jgi:hypothetical protein
MDYNEWNEQLFASFFNSNQEGKQVLLYVSKDILRDIAAGSFKTAEDAHSDFCRAVVSHSRNDICMATADWAQAVEWRVACETQAQQAPPYLGFLALFVSVLTRDPALNERGYYESLNNLLNAHGYNGTPVTSLRNVECAWEDLEVWSQKVMTGRLGAFTNRQIGGYSYVGKPKANALLSPSDSRRLWYFFSRFEPSHLPDKRTFTGLIYQNRATCLTPTTSALFDGYDEQIKEALLGLAYVKLHEWKDAGAPIYLRGGSHEEIDDSRGVSTSGDMPLTCLLACYTDDETGEINLCVYAKRSGSGDAPEQMTFSFEGKRYELPKVWTEKALYGPASTADHYFQPSDLDHDYLFSDSQELQKSGHYTDPLRFLEESGCLGSWLEIKPEQLVIGNTYRVLANKARAQAICTFLEKNDAREIDAVAMPSNWSLFYITYQAGDGLVAPSPRAARILELEGGIRTRSGAGSEYFDFSPPFARRSSAGQVVAVHSDGTRHPLPVIERGNVYEIPAHLLRSGELTLCLIDGDDVSGQNPRSRNLRFAPPSMPRREDILLSQTPLTKASLDYSGAFFPTSIAPPFLANSNDVKLVFASESEFRGTIRTYKPDRFPAVTLEKPANIDVEITCDNVAVDINKDGRLQMPLIAHERGAHQLVCSWMGLKVCTEEYEIREIPRLLCESHKPLSKDPSSDRVFLKSPTPIVVLVDPMEAGIRLLVDEKAQRKSPDGSFQIVPNGDEFTVSLIWRGQRVIDETWRLMEPPSLELSIEGEPLAGFRAHSFKRSQLPVVRVVRPQGEPLALRCFGLTCEDLGRHTFGMPKNLPARIPLPLTCSWRNHEIASFNGPRGFVIEDPPEIKLILKGGRPLAGLGANCYLNGYPPRVQLRGKLAGVGVNVNGNRHEVNPDGILQLHSGTLLEGENSLEVTWHGDIIVSPTVLRFLPGPAVNLELSGGNRISPQQTNGVYLLVKGQGLPRVSISHKGYENSNMSLLLNKAPLLGNELPASAFKHGETTTVSVLWEETPLPVTKRIIVLKDYDWVGSQVGQVASYNAETEWESGWVVSKIGKTSYAFPRCLEMLPPRMPPEATKAVSKGWKKLISNSELYQKAYWPEEIRTAWHLYRELARNIR